MNSSDLVNVTPVKLSAYTIAEAFCELDGDEMAMFFNAVEHRCRLWRASMSMQLQYVTDSEKLTHEGRSFMAKIGEYSTVTPRTDQ